MIRVAIEEEVKKALLSLGADVSFQVKLTEERAHGDYMTNAPLVAAKILQKNPKAVAEELVSILKESPLYSKVEVAGPGFVNFFITKSALLEASEQNILFSKKNARINIEFISANPTGDLHIGHGRGAFYGDVLSRVWKEVGESVSSEYYINDAKASKQIGELGKTALGEGEQYKTERLEKLLESFEKKTDDPKEEGYRLAHIIHQNNKKFISEKLGVSFDVWYSEQEKLYDTNANNKTLEELKERGHVYEKEGALWLRTEEYGDDEDRVIVRSDGSQSYFLSDISYHKDKFSRGYTHVFNVWGADHHGHVKRMQAVARMLSWTGVFHIFITQLVSIKEAGEAKKMSKRAGNVILLEDLVDEFGIDSVRWFFLEKALGTHIEFDPELAKEKSPNNPVYYAQYAHARICSIERKVKELRANTKTLESLIDEESGKELLLKVLEYPDVVERVRTTYETHQLPLYAYELAHKISSFYRDVRVIEEGDTYHPGALLLLGKARERLAKTLGLLGISAPSEM